MDYFDQIKDYINGELTPDQHKAFEEELGRNAELARAVKQYPATETVYDALFEKNIRTQLSQFQQQRQEEQQPKTRTRVIALRKALAVAASLLLILVATLWYANSQYSDTALIARYYDPPNLSRIKGETSQSSLLDAAKAAFTEQKYEQTIELLSTIPENDPDYQEVRLILGFAFLKTQQAEQAIPIFSALIGDNHIRRDRAEWHLVLSYLQAGDSATAKTHLDAIAADTSHDYHIETLELQLRLNSGWRKLVVNK